jgi:UDP-glucose 4-epimerase
VLEVIDAARRVSGRDFEVEFAARRSGDPAALVADATKARRVLSWEPRYSDLETIIRDAWSFEQRQT